MYAGLVLTKRFFVSSSEMLGSFSAWAFKLTVWEPAVGMNSSGGETLWTMKVRVFSPHAKTAPSILQVNRSLWLPVFFTTSTAQATVWPASMVSGTRARTSSVSFSNGMMIWDASHAPSKATTMAADRYCHVRFMTASCKFCLNEVKSRNLTLRTEREELPSLCFSQTPEWSRESVFYAF
ncbi:MAG: hypothetical protein V2A55_02280 [Candidatus Jorgensenbacteria bacterium]